MILNNGQAPLILPSVCLMSHLRVKGRTTSCWCVVVVETYFRKYSWDDQLHIPNAGIVVEASLYAFCCDGPTWRSGSSSTTCLRIHSFSRRVNGERPADSREGTLNRCSCSTLSYGGCFSYIIVLNCFLSIFRLFTPYILNQYFHLMRQLNVLTIHDVIVTSSRHVSAWNAIFREYTPS